MKDLLGCAGEVGASVIITMLGMLTIAGAEMRQAKLDDRWKTQRAAQVVAVVEPPPKECLIPKDILVNPKLVKQLTKNCELIKLVDTPEVVDKIKVEKAAPKKEPLISKENEKKTLEFLEELRKELEKRNATASENIQ